MGALPAATGHAAPPQPEIALGRPIVLLADTRVYSYHVPPPAEFSALRVQNATINVQFLTAGQSDLFGKPCLDWPDNAKTAYRYAADIWETQIYSPVPILVQACWADLGSGLTLGYGGPVSIRNFPGAPYPNTWYAMALANALSGQDLNGSNRELFTTYNKNHSWYFGTDGNTPSGRYDFASVVLHEIAHGLGFSGSMNVSGDQGSWGSGSPPSPGIYDRFTEDGAGNALINYASPSTALASALTSDNVWFDGPNARTANGGGRVKLYAPATWLPGSSYSHLDYNTYVGTLNGLMVYQLASATSIHHPGPVTLGILKDLGWQLATSLAPDLSPSTKTVAPEQATAGEMVTFTVRLVNSGILSATVSFTDTLPDTLQLHGSPTASSGPVPAVNEQTITWQGTVTSATTVTITYAAVLTPTMGTAVNQAWIDDGVGNVCIRRAFVNGRKVFLPLTLRNYGP